MEKWLNWWKTDRRWSLALKLVLMGFLPLASCLIYCAVQGRSIGEVYLPGSEWNDELFYFKQVEGMLKYGYPLGYFGFNESHALKLSFAAWSPVLVFPWLLWGLAFGWNLLSPVLCNIALMTVTMLLFVWLVRPTWRQLGGLSLLFLLFTPFVRYMLSGMPEVICFSLLIIFYSAAVSYLRKESWSKLATLFVLSGLLTLMRPYMLLFLLLPMCFWTAKSKWKGLAGSLAVSGTVLGIYGMIKHYLGAEYFAPLFFTDWVTAFFDLGLFGGIRYFLSKLYWNGTAFLQHMLQAVRSGLASGAFFWGYLTVMAVLLYQSAADWLKLRREGECTAQRTSQDGLCSERETGRQSAPEDAKALRNQFIIEAHLAFSFVGMLFALLLMYKLTEGSKHLLTFLAAGVFVISLMRTRTYKKTALVGVVFAFFYMYMALDPYDYQVPFAEADRVAQVDYWQREYAEKLEITQENIPNYDNSVIWVFSDAVDGEAVNLKWQLLYGLPQGFGISCCMPDYVAEHFGSLQCRYLAAPSGGTIDGLCREAGYRELGRDADLVVYERYE